MFFKNNYYKGYDIESNDRLEKYKNEYSNPYGYNLESNLRKSEGFKNNIIYTNQNLVKSNKLNKK